MLVSSKIILYFLFVFFIGAVLGCSLTGTSSHLDILNTGVDLNGMASIAVDPFKGTVPVRVLELMAVLAVIILTVVVFWRLTQMQHHLLLNGNILERWQLRLQATLTRLYNHLVIAFSRGILHPNIY